MRLQTLALSLIVALTSACTTVEGTIEDLDSPGGANNSGNNNDPGGTAGGPTNPTGTGDGGYKIKAEFNSTPHVPGVLSMARANDPNSAGTQFFICLGTHKHLDRNYTAFGKVADEESMKTVQAIGAVKTGANDKPVEKVSIKKATVTATPKK